MPTASRAMEKRTRSRAGLGKANTLKPKSTCAGVNVAVTVRVG